jgi:hypothetical protein
MRRAVCLSVCALAAIVAGCGGSKSSSTTTTTSTAPPAGVAGAEVHSGQSAGSGLIALPNGVGSLSYRCDHGNQGVSATLGGRILATESVYVEGDAHRHLRASRNVIASPFAVTDARGATLLWHVIQTTEPRTLDVRIAIDFHRAPAGPDCSPVRWTSTVYVISHSKAWSAPPGWL